MRSFTTPARMVASLAGTILLLVGAVPSANAYPDPVIEINLGDAAVVSGESINITLTSSVDCDWTATLDEQRNSGSGTTFTTTFTAPVVEETTRFPLVASCSYVTGQPSRSGERGLVNHRATAVTPFAATRSTASRTFYVTVYASTRTAQPDAVGGVGGVGVLGDTGGPARWLVPVGGGLLLAGGAVAMASRRRSLRRW